LFLFLFHNYHAFGRGVNVNPFASGYIGGLSCLGLSTSPHPKKLYKKVTCMEEFCFLTENLYEYFVIRNGIYHLHHMLKIIPMKLKEKIF